MGETRKDKATDDNTFLLHANQLIFLYFVKKLVHLKNRLFLENNHNLTLWHDEICQVYQKIVQVIFPVMSNHANIIYVLPPKSSFYNKGLQESFL